MGEPTQAERDKVGQKQADIRGKLTKIPLSPGKTLEEKIEEQKQLANKLRQELRELGKKNK